MSNVVPIRPFATFGVPLAQLEVVITGLETFVTGTPSPALRQALDDIAEASPGSPWVPWAPATIVSALIESELIRRGHQ